jgi:hypothetical protein
VKKAPAKKADEAVEEKPKKAPKKDEPAEEQAKAKKASPKK